MSRSRKIVVRGAREHNLKGVDLEIPRDRLVVVTGTSGSGKSSLAFDTIYAEGQRRYVESLSAYARQFLEQMQKPDVDGIEGLPPTISIEQRTGRATPRSTVATSTEVYDYLRLLFARIGKAFCYRCERPITQQTAEQIVDHVLGFRDRTKLMILAPVVRGKKGEHREVFRRIRREGFMRVRVDGVVQELADVLKPHKNRKHDIDVVVDRIVLERSTRRRLADSIETAVKMGEGLVTVLWEEKKAWKERLYSEHYACPKCSISYGEIQPRLFSFNSPYGACETCDGLGTKLELDADLIITDKTLSIKDGAIGPWRRMGRRMTIRYNRRLREYCARFNVRQTTAFVRIASEKKRILLHGTNAQDEKKYGAWFEGVIPNLMQRFERTDSEFVKHRIMGYMSESECPSCGGKRLRPEALSIRVGERNIYELCAMTIDEAAAFFGRLSLSREERHIARLVLKEVRNRLTFLRDVGLGYLTLDRKSSTLAGGEAQRIRLASQVGSGLVGVCYVLDEPTIGLHARDNARLIETLTRLRDLGNTVIVVEHDEDMIRAADQLIDIGPGAGAHGGEVVVQGSLAKVTGHPRSLTGQYLSGEARIAVPEMRRRPAPAKVTVKGARENNLKDLTVSFPVGVFTCVTGVSGSGKSTLVAEILYRSLARSMHGARGKPGAHDAVTGSGHLDRVIEIDQSPIGRTPRSNPATYTGAFDEVRKLFAMTKEAKARGYKPGRFSFNVRGGRCEACEGQGTKVIEMHFLPDVYVTCEECRGRRYNRETLEVKYRGKDIADVLEMPIEEAVAFFTNIPKAARILQTLEDVGLGYMALGQASTTLAGGEAQRVKLSTELGKTSTGKTLYILDEPTTGLHFADIEKLLTVLNRLVEMGNTVVVIEHNMHVVKTADWIVDLGPEGGNDGGRVVAEGTPEQIAAHRTSYTGRSLKPYLRLPPDVKAHAEENASALTSKPRRKSATL
ncbi:MAG: excinuclease ABC subunit UvrA [Planctomycetota bacterium]